MRLSCIKPSVKKAYNASIGEGERRRPISRKKYESLQYGRRLGQKRLTTGRQLYMTFGQKAKSRSLYLCNSRNTRGVKHPEREGLIVDNLWCVRVVNTWGLTKATANRLFRTILSTFHSSIQPQCSAATISEAPTTTWCNSHIYYMWHLWRFTDGLMFNKKIAQHPLNQHLCLYACSRSTTPSYRIRN